jgi:hypothetical protein
LGHDDKLPTIADMLVRLQAVLQGRLTREELSSWAETWVMAQAPPDMDPKVWSWLDTVSGVDMPDPTSPSRKWVYTDDDIRSWIAQLEA